MSVSLYHGQFCRNPLHPGPCKGWKKNADWQPARKRKAAAPRAAAPARSSQSAYEGRQDALRAGVASGVASKDQLSGGFMGETNRLTFEDGSKGVSKRPFGTWGNVTADDQLQAEELTAAMGSALGAGAPAVVRDGDTVYMELVDGKTAAAHRMGGVYVVPDEITDSPAGRAIAMLDVLTNNPDRASGNWMLGEDRVPRPIDHGMAWHTDHTNVSAAVRSPFATRNLIHEDGTFREPNNLSIAEVEATRAKVEALRPQFEAAGRKSWINDAMKRLNELEKRTPERWNEL